MIHAASEALVAEPVLSVELPPSADLSATGQSSLFQQSHVSMLLAICVEFLGKHKLSCSAVDAVVLEANMAEPM